MEHRTRQFYIVLVILIPGMAAYQMTKITGPVMLPDEFGYWANAAQIVGYDWSSVVSLQSYYSFGYSVLLVPFLKIISRPELLYKTAVLLNVLFVFLHGVLLWRLADMLNPEKKRHNFFYCLMAACYPNLLFNMQLTWTECLLALMFVGSVWLFLKCGKCRGKRQMCYGVLFTCCLVYLYFVHMRTLGVLLSGLFAQALMWFKGWNRTTVRKELKRPLYRIVLWLLLVVAFLIIGNLIKDWLQGSLYSEADKAYLGINDYGGQIGRFWLLLNWEGLWRFIVSCAGKLFYLGISTCGTVYFGIWYVTRRVMKNKVYLYVLLSGFITFGITAFYTMDGGRPDAYLNGRYNEFLIPLFIYFGLCEMYENRYIWRAAIGIILLQGGIARLLLWTMPQERTEQFQGYFTVGISYVLREYMPRVSDYVLYPLAAGTMVMLLLILTMGVLVRKKEALLCYLLLFVLLYLYTAMSSGWKYIYDHSMDTGEDLALLAKIKEGLEDGDTVLFINSDSYALYLDIIQFGLREHPLQVVEEADVGLQMSDRPNYVFTYHNCGQEKLLKMFYDTVLETWHFKLYCNRAAPGIT